MDKRLEEFFEQFPHPVHLECIDRSVQKTGMGLIVSGGQTGTDRAAFDVALELAIPFTGFAPRGLIDERGSIPETYRVCMREPQAPWEIPAPLDVFAERTELNAMHSQGTLVLSPGEPVGGTLLTVEYAQRHHKPCLVVDLVSPGEVLADYRRWKDQFGVFVLNVAGPRESLMPGTIYSQSAQVLQRLLGAVPPL